MSDDVMDFLDLMAREGPCYHCGIDYTPLWRIGPPGKPVLCNACGSWWKAKGSLQGYVRKHGIKDPQGSQSSKFTRKQNPSSSATTEAKKTASLWDTGNVSTGKRSKLKQYVLSPTEMLHQQLYYAHQSSEFAKKTGDDAEDVLIFEQVNRYIPDNDIGLGCMLLKPHSPAKDSQLDSPLDQKSATFQIKESKPESSVGFQPVASPPKDTKPDSPKVFQFQATFTKALKLQQKTGSSSSVNIPTGEPSQ